MRPIIIASLLAAAPFAVAAQPAVTPEITAAIADSARPNGNVDSDANRKPAETLAFAGVRPGMIVGEYYPGSGYFTQLISDVVGPAGHVYAQGNDAWQTADDAKAKIVGATGHWENVSFLGGAFAAVDFPQPLDIVWLTQNYHDLKITEYGDVDTLAFDRSIYNALKPGGVFFIIDHDGKPGMTAEDIASLHRIDKQQVIDEVTAAGFKLEAEGTFLANAADDHSLPVFDKSIRGHTDQYVLKFVKPAN